MHRVNGTWHPDPRPVSDVSVLGFSIVSWGPGRFDVFGTSPPSNSIWHYRKGGPDAPSNSFEKKELGGPADSQPCAVTWGPTRLDVCVKFSDGNVYHKYSEDAHRWTQWTNIGGPILGLPYPASWGQGRIDLAVCGTDNAIYHKSYTGDDWEPPQTSFSRISDIGPSTPSSPLEVSWGEARLDLFTHASGSLRAIYHKAHVPGQGWEPSVMALEPDPLGSQFTANTGHVVAPSANHLDIVALTDSGEVYHKALIDTTWSSRGGTFARLGRPASRDR